METSKRLKIGEYLVQEGLIQASQIPLILDHSQKTGLRFGEAAIDLEIIQEQNLIDLFGPQYKTDFFKVSPDYFPKETKDLIPRDLIFKFGCLPLGRKKIGHFFKADELRLNVGLVEPSEEKCAALRKELGNQCQLKFFLILPTDWLQVMKTVYQVSDQEILDSKNIGKLDPRISHFF